MSITTEAPEARTATGRARTSSARSGVDSLVEDNLALVGHIVREIMTRLPAHVNRDDLVSAGMAALVVSAQGYDESRGVPFARFAAIRIRGALVDELRSMDWASRSVRGRAREVEQVRNQLAVTLSRSPRADEVANSMGVSVSELSAIDAGASMMPDNQRGPEQLLLDREQLGYLHDAIDELPERLRYVVRAYFFEQRQMSDIATELGVTESRISQLRAEALKLMRHGLAITQPQGKNDTEPTGRAGARVASYAAAVAARGTLNTRLAITNPMAEITISAIA
jgi:RNA polymerase sigma factor FliA